MPVAAIMGRNRQSVRAADIDTEFGRTAPGLVGIIGVESTTQSLRGLGAIVERAQEGVERVLIRSRLQRGPVAKGRD